MSADQAREDRTEGFETVEGTEIPFTRMKSSEDYYVTHYGSPKAGEPFQEREDYIGKRKIKIYCVTHLVKHERRGGVSWGSSITGNPKFALSGAVLQKYQTALDSNEAKIILAKLQAILIEPDRIHLSIPRYKGLLGQSICEMVLNGILTGKGENIRLIATVAEALRLDREGESLRVKIVEEAVAVANATGRIPSVATLVERLSDIEPRSARINIKEAGLHWLPAGSSKAIVCRPPRMEAF